MNFMNKIEFMFNDRVLQYTLLRESLNSNELLISHDKLLPVDIIVSLTTYSKRINDVHLVIESINRQTIKPNRIILWLDEDEFCIDSIPLVLHKQINRGLEVRFCQNIRSYKKLIPTLQLSPESNVITIDDDIIYPFDMIEQLVMEHKRNPALVIGHRAHRIKYDKSGNILPYKKWDLNILSSIASDDVFITSGGGTFFPHNCFNSEVENEASFMSLCPSADDVWIKAMLILNGVKCKKISDSRPFEQRFHVLPQGQDISLYLSNISENQNQNDKQIKYVFDKYNLFIR
jgi:hypothetical protein